ncbi:MAG: hypothetical protein ACOCP8_07765 [archaeon]
MKILIQFSNQNNKSEVITPFIGLEDCIADDDQLVVPGIIKINYSGNTMECYCFGLDVTEKVLSNICNIEIDSEGNNGIISFPKSLSNVLIQSKIINFNKVLDLSSKGKVQYVNTNKQSLKSLVPLSQWLSADLNVNKQKVFINFKFNDYKINVSDGSAMSFCERVKEHPLISASSLANYFDFGSEIKIKPNIEYLCFWKVLKSPNGYKKYSNFINATKDKINVIYDSKGYSCRFNGGKIDFQLLSMGDKYPKKVLIQIEQLNDPEILKNIQSYLNFKNIDLVAKVTNLRLDTMKLLHELNFYKDNDFFIFTNVLDNFEAKYDIGSGMLTIKQSINIENKIEKEFFNKSIIDINNWINNLINMGN